MNNKIYIGQSRYNLSHRKSGHKYSVQQGEKCRFYDAIRKHGWDSFQWEVIEECESLQELNEREVYWIKYFNSYLEGYNSTKGGDINPMDDEEVKQRHLDTVQSKEFREKQSSKMKSVVKQNGFTEEHRNKISEKLKGNKHFLGKTHSEEWRKAHSERISGENHPMYGKNHSQESIEKIRQASLDRAYMFNKSVHQYSLQGELLQTFDSVKGAAEWVKQNTRFVKAHPDTIKNCQKNKGDKQGVAWGYKWIYQDDKSSVETIENTSNDGSE